MNFCKVRYRKNASPVIHLFSTWKSTEFAPEVARGKIPNAELKRFTGLRLDSLFLDPNQNYHAAEAICLFTPGTVFLDFLRQKKSILRT